MSYELQRFSTHLQNFCDELELWPKSQALLVSVSGGVDSMALLVLCAELKKRKKLSSLRAFHLNHGTRGLENQKEEQLVIKKCQELGIEFVIKKEQLDLTSSNFEARAREVRRKALLSALRPGEWAATGHHLDDSFEWSWIQMGRSGHLPGILGIPVYAPPIIRPMLCFSREQIERLAKKIGLEYLNDSSNFETRYLRNYLRSEVLKAYKKRFPRYLRHYVERHNQLARIYGVSRFNHVHEAVADWGQYLQMLRHGVWEIKNPRKKRNDWSGVEETLRFLIAKLSNKKRGSLTQEIHKLIAAAKIGRRGPMSFSGGVKIWPRKGLIVLASAEGEAYAASYVKQMDKMKKCLP